jgi:prophage regulatory protein
MRKLLSLKQVRERVLYSPAHLARLEADGKFPKRVKLSKHRTGRVGWVEEEIEAYLQERMEARSSS